jgi:3-methylcrotonyl-CoA carboxylase beta subunit
MASSDLDFNKYEDKNKQMLSQLKRTLAKIHLGGGEKRNSKTT